MRKFAFAACMLAGMAFAETTPVMVSLVTPVQAPSRSYDVTGFRLSLIYGDCRDFTGLDIGVADRTAGEFTGLVLGGVNIADGRFRGGQLGLVNWNSHDDARWERRSVGAQVGILNYSNAFCGLQDGVVNVSESFAGLQSSLVNFAQDMYGVQCGYYFIFGINVAGGAMRGCQLGLVNYANTMEEGIQIGLVNIISRNGWLPVLPIVNGHF